MKTLCMVTALCLLILPATHSRAESNLVWITDFEEATAQATQRGIPVLANFSGSDWCGWCIKLGREVFSEKDFATFAQTGLILFLADFPAKTVLPEKLRAQNERLAQEYAVRGFPTVLLLDPKGAVLARTGYRPGGATSYVDHLKKLIKQDGEPEKAPERSK